MANLKIKVFKGGLLLASVVSALQVAPSSPCASACIDNIMDDPTDPDSSNTYETDIVCADSDYNSTDSGKKFQECLTCLQTSDASGHNETDQQWFFYNLRYAVDTCLYGYPNTTSSIVSPCMVADSSCAAFKSTLEGDDLDPTSSPYAYCSSDGSSYSGSDLQSCITCVQEMGDENYLANFLIALEAGCEQKPAAGTIVGLNQTIFATGSVTITAAVVASSASSSKSSGGLSKGAIIGMAVGGFVLVVLIIAVGFICIKKKRNSRNHLSSRTDPRFGSKAISSPLRGAYSSQNSPPIQEAPYKPYIEAITKETKGTAGEYYDLQERYGQYPPHEEHDVQRDPAILPRHKAYKRSEDLSSGASYMVASPTTTLVSTPHEVLTPGSTRSASRRRAPNQPSHIRIISESSLPQSAGYGEGERSGGSKHSRFSPSLRTGGSNVSNGTTLHSEVSPPLSGSRRPRTHSGSRQGNSPGIGADRPGMTYGEHVFGLKNRTMQGGQSSRTERFSIPVTPIDDSSHESLHSVEQWPGSM